MSIKYNQIIVTNFSVSQQHKLDFTRLVDVHSMFVYLSEVTEEFETSHTFMKTVAKEIYAICVFHSIFY